MQLISFFILYGKHSPKLFLVRSLGTEDRVPNDPVPAREEIFEYIVFRGHDIEDLHVCEAPNPPVEDPAIIHVSYLFCCI